MMTVLTVVLGIVASVLGAILFGSARAFRAAEKTAVKADQATKAAEANIPTRPKGKDAADLLRRMGP